MEKSLLGQEIMFTVLRRMYNQKKGCSIRVVSIEDGIAAIEVTEGDA